MNYHKPKMFDIQGLSSSPAPSLRPAARLKLRFQCSSKRFRIIFWTSLLYCGRFQKAECRDHKESPPTPILKSDPNKLPGWSQYLRNFETQEWTQNWSVNPFFSTKALKMACQNFKNVFFCITLEEDEFQPTESELPALYLHTASISGKVFAGFIVNIAHEAYYLLHRVTFRDLCTLRQCKHFVIMWD